MGDSEDFEARMDMETLERAQEIKSNPSRLKRAREAAREQARRFEKVAGGSDDSPETRGYRRL